MTVPWQRLPEVARLRNRWTAYVDGLDIGAAKTDYDKSEA